MPCLIINADDLGYSPAVNQAIADLHRAGLVTSASLLVNQPHSPEAAEIALGLRSLSIGVHLNLSRGRPLLPIAQVPSLVDETGQLWTTTVFYGRALLGQINWYEAAAELEAQVAWAIAHGLHLDNLDSHVHFHLLPPARRLTEDLANRYGVGAWRCPDVLATLLPNRLWNDLLATPPKPGPLLTPHYLLSLHQWGYRLLEDKRLGHLLGQPGTVSELIVHPGYKDDPDLPRADQLQPLRRQAETDLLSDPAFYRWIKSQNLRLISFADLADLT